MERFMLVKSLPRVTVPCNTIRLLRQTSLALPDNRAVRMLHATRMAIMADIAAREIRVDVFDMVKQKSNSVMKNITILIRNVEGSRKYEVDLTSRRRVMTYDHMRSAHGRLKMIAIGSRPKTL